MQILQMLKDDHAEAKQLLEQIVETGGVKARRKLFATMKAALLAHAAAEQQVFYAALKEDEDSFDKALEAEVEHEIVERLLQQLSESDSEAEDWAVRCKVLQELVQHHVEEEERSLFKIARKVFDKDRLVELGEDFQAAKEQHMQEVGAE